MTLSGASLSPNNELFGNLKPMPGFSLLPPIVELVRVLAVIFPTATWKFSVCIIVSSSSGTFLALVVARSVSREFTNLFVCSFVSAKLFVWFFVSTTYRITMKYNFSFDYIPADICLFKVNNRNTRTRCKIYSKLTIMTSERRLASFWWLYC